MKLQPNFEAAAACLVNIHQADVRIAGKALLDAVSAGFACGHVTAILGPNGAGKSTLMSLLTGQRVPDGTGGGSVRWAGQPLTAHPSQVLARTRAFVAQESQVAFEFTVREVVGLGRYPHRNQPVQDERILVNEALHTTRVAHLHNQPVSTLSGGEKARVQLSRALAQVARAEGNPACTAPSDWLPAARWLLLDEPTAALDLQHQHQALAAVQRWAATPGTGAVAVLHDLNLALRYCSYCVLLDKGRVVASGLTAEVLTAAQIAALWGVRATLVELEEMSEIEEIAPEVSSGDSPKLLPESQKRPKKVPQYLFQPANTCTSSYQNDSELAALQR